MYRYLLFDADDTIFDFALAEKTALKTAMIECGVDFKDEYIPLYSKMNLEMWKKLERKEITKKELIDTRFSNFFKLIGIDNDGQQMKTSYRNNLGKQCHVLPGAKELLLKLKDDHYICLITNGLKDVQTGRLVKSGIDRIVDGVFISEEVGFEKPDKRYFDYVKSHIPGFKDEEAVVIGDSLTSDIKGGNNAGIDTIWFNRKNEINNHAAEPTYEAKTFDGIFNIITG